MTDSGAAQDYVRVARGPGVGARLRSSRGVMLVVGFFVVALVAVGLTRSDRDYTDLSIHNPDANGVMALAEVARERGVALRQISELQAANIGDPMGTTLVIASGADLFDLQAQSILAYPGPIVVLGDSAALQAELSDSFATVMSGATTLTAACTSRAAAAAGSVSTDGRAYVGAPEDASTCFESEGSAAYVAVHREGQGDVTFFASPESLTNGSVLDEGNAALGLHLIGGHDKAVWYLGSFTDGSFLTWSRAGDYSPPDVDPSADFLPPGTGNAFYALALALVFVAVWRARRFGALVREPLPVVIRASEATRGRARLYRAAGATGRAAASLRAAAAVRMGRRLGVGRSSDSEVLVNAIVRATGRHRDVVASLLYGPAPQNESQMMTLIDQIDALESEVHRS